jgi:hypothetical protein
MPAMILPTVRALLLRGVIAPYPETVVVADDVDPTRVEPGAILHPFTRLEGARTLIGRGARIGSGGPTYVRDCAIGRNVDLASGTFEDSVFFDGAAFGPSGHAREGTIFEEGARAAHACGVKQTILLPYATLGSLINFCDCLLSGGTGPDDHAEVGSGFIHFNFTPSGAKGDKATPSLFGDVVSGVFLRKRRIFLGGDGGAVGPIRVDFGTVLAAGSTYRRDRGPDLLVYGEPMPDRARGFDPLVFRNAKEKIAKNVGYLAELAALRCFYAEFRTKLSSGDAFKEALLRAGIAALDGAAVERVKRIEALAADFRVSAARLIEGGAAPDASEPAYQAAFGERFRGVKAALLDLAGAAIRAPRSDRWTATLDGLVPDDRSAPDRVRALGDGEVAAGTERLGAVAAAYRDGAAAIL